MAVTAIVAFLLRRQRLVLIAFAVWTANWIAHFTFAVRICHSYFLNVSRDRLSVCSG
jgi:hypothetical protein